MATLTHSKTCRKLYYGYIEHLIERDDSIGEAIDAEQSDNGDTGKSSVV